jgi:hypothetical protein
VTILHRTDPTFGVQHFVDVVPFTAAGRPLPSQRVQAQRCGGVDDRPALMAILESATIRSRVF